MRLGRFESCPAANRGISCRDQDADKIRTQRHRLQFIKSLSLLKSKASRNTRVLYVRV